MKQSAPNPDPGALRLSAPDVLEHLSTAVLLIDDGFELLALNPAAEALLDVSATTVCGIQVAALFPETPELADALARVLDTARPLAERGMTLVLPGAETITVDCFITPISGSESPARILVELVHLARHIQITREEWLLSQNESARALVRRLAHEIKNPLGGLRGAAQLLERELPVASLREYTAIIIQEADRLQKLVDRMLGPRTPLRKRAVNVHEITERVCGLLRAEAPAAVAIERDYDPSIPALLVDPELLIQVMLNIVRNAVQAVEASGCIVVRTRVQRQVTIGHRQHPLVCRIDISDDGPGVPDELADSVFYPMVTGRSDGTGLGLSIAQSLVYRHAGLIECSSVPGATTFSIILPLDTGGDTVSGK